MSSKKDSLVNFYSEEEQAKLLTFCSADKIKTKPVARPVIKPPVIEKAAAVASDNCEFVREFVYPGSENRLCITATFCPKSIFSDPEVYTHCCTRIEKLKEQT